MGISTVMKTVALLVLLLVTAGLAGATTGPRLSIRSAAPIVISATGFEKSTSVRVSVAYGTHKVAATVRTSSAGAFTRRWPIMVGACTKVSALAVSAHRRATAAWRPAQDCGLTP